MRSFFDELRQAGRRLRRRPAMALVAGATLAVGIGGATAVFSVAHAVLLRPLPYASPDRLVLVWQQDPERSQPFVEMSYPAFRDWRSGSAVFEELAGMPSTNQGFTMTGRGEPVALTGRLVTWSFFRTLGVAPLLGRGFEPDDDRRGAPRVVVLGHELWQERFGADPHIVGTSLVLDREPFTVVGVMPPGFDYPAGASLWTPMVPGVSELAEQPGVFWMSGLGRLKPGLGLEQARRDLASFASRYNAEKYQDKSLTAVVTPLADAVLGPTRGVLLALLGGVGLVLLVACVNVAGLQLVRVEERAPEMALRRALGASPARIARGLLAESLVVGLLGGGVGTLLAFAGVPLLMALSPRAVPRLEDAKGDPAALLVALGLTLATSVLTGLAPALAARRGSLREALSATTRGLAVGGSRWRGALVATEVALALVLLAGAGLLLRSFVALRDVPVGYDADQVVAVEAGPAESRFPDSARQRAYVEAAVARLRALPGVDSAAAVTLRPLWGTVGMDWPFTVEGQSKTDAERNPLLNFETVTPGYFRTMGIHLRGRDFDEQDREGRPGVAIVSETFARRYWPGRDPIGQRLKVPLPPTEYHDAWLTVIGVAGDARYRELAASRLDFYMSHRQSDHRAQHLVLRTRAESAGLAASVLRVLRELDPEQPAPRIVPLRDAVSEALGTPRFAARVLSAFAAVALLLAALGLYGSVAYSVGRRTREIGVRVALGARPRHIAGLVFREGLLPALAGIVLGTALALQTAQLIAGLLFGVGPSDVTTLASAAALLTLTAVLASALPARRATGIAPVVALREP
jgi:predicted permease